MANYCEDCGCKVFNGGCTNCHEELYIIEQYDELNMAAPDDETEFMRKAHEQQKQVADRNYRSNNT